MVSLVFLSAFEALAVTTIMPSVSADLDGRAWFSAAFSATLAASVVGMVAGGLWSDRIGPRLPLLASVAVFAGGLLLAGLAPGIEVFVAARFLQGLGSGAMTVALYVVVARIYAPIDHPRIFGAFAAAWVIPSMVGPTIAGAVGEASAGAGCSSAWWRWPAARRRCWCPRYECSWTTPEPSSVATGGRLVLAASSPAPWSPSTSRAAPPPRSASWPRSSLSSSSWSPSDRCCPPAPSPYAVACPR